MVATCRRSVRSGPGASSCSHSRSSTWRATICRRGCRRSCRSSPPLPSRRSSSSPAFAPTGNGGRSPTRGLSSATSTSSAGKPTHSPSDRARRSSCFAPASWTTTRSPSGWRCTAMSSPHSGRATTSSLRSRPRRARLPCTSSRRGDPPGAGREHAWSRRSSCSRSLPACSSSTRVVSTGSTSRRRRARRPWPSSTGRRLGSRGTRPT